MFEVTHEAAAMAKAILRGDSTAAAALADWVTEQCSSRPISRLSFDYIEKLEAVVRDFSRTVHNYWMKAGWDDDSGKVEITVGDCRKIILMADYIETMPDANSRGGNYRNTL